MEATKDLAVNAQAHVNGKRSASPFDELDVDLRARVTTTVSRYFLDRVAERDARVAMRHKRMGLWRSITWREYGEQARTVAMALLALDLRRGEVISILSENSPEWMFVDMGAMAVGGISNGIYTTDSADQVAFIVNDSNTHIYFAENEEQLDKILSVRDRCPSLRHVVVFDMEGLRGFQDPMVMSFEDFMSKGRAFDAANPGRWEQEVNQGRPEDIAVLVYTSGTTGRPKGVMLSHRNIMFQIESNYDVLDMRPNDEQLTFLPLCHIAERTFTTFWALRAGSTINFAESIEAVPRDIREVQPTIFFATPRIWEKFYSAIALQMTDAIWVGRAGYALALAVGGRVADTIMDGRTPGPMLRAAFWVADQLVLRNVKRLIGLDRARFMVSGAAPVAPDLLRWYLSIGLPISEMYGQTECCGLATAPPLGVIRLGKVGRAAPHVQVRIADDGEVLLRGPNVFEGYLNNPDATRETYQDGWLYTGDVGELDDDGWLRITDRKRDIIITAGGKNITPSEIENQLKFSPYISDAVVLGDKRKYLTCLVMIDHENVAKFAQDQSVPFTNFASLCRTEAVQDLIWSEIEKANTKFARVETIKKFRLIDRLLTAEDDELTPTMKLKRKLVNDKYKDLIDDMYRDA